MTNHRHRTSINVCQMGLENGEWLLKGDGISLLNVLEFDSSDDCTGFGICQNQRLILSKKSVLYGMKIISQ